MLILIDLDKTLIDEDYQLTSDGILPAIANAIRAGHQIGLSSDSSATSLAIWRDRLGMNGPILAERGAVFQRRTDEQLKPTGSAEPAFFRDLRMHMIEQLIEHLQDDVLLCDPTESIREHRYTSESPRQLTFINAYRCCSFHATFRTIGPGVQKISPANKSRVETAERLFMDYCSIRGLPLNSFFVDANPEYSLLIIHDRRSDKRYGTAYAMRELQTQECIVIGDGVNDFTGLSNVRHWAVGNANSMFKEQCERIAIQTYTAGVIELLLTLS